MTQINIGNKIRELRKKKGITQEALAATLSVSPQAVSKWEMGLTYPDMAMIPAIAGYFGVSLDVLFDYDVADIATQVAKIIRDAKEYFYSDPLRYAETMTTALENYPGNEALLEALIDAYEYDMRENGNTAHMEDIVSIAQKIISESRDFPRICNVKILQATVYLQMGQYDTAKSILSTLPDSVDLKSDAMALHLKAKDKVNGAIRARCYHLQMLYIACFEEGNAWFNMDQYPDTVFGDITPPEYIPEALKFYRKGLAVLETFLVTEYGYEVYDQYLWEGMQTFHWGFYQRIAACHKRLGQMEECNQALEQAYRIISTAWKDFEENRAYYMDPFNEYLKEYGLGEYIR